MQNFLGRWDTATAKWYCRDRWRCDKILKFKCYSWQLWTHTSNKMLFWCQVSQFETKLSAPLPPISHIWWSRQTHYLFIKKILTKKRKFKQWIFYCVPKGIFLWPLMCTSHQQITQYKNILNIIVKNKKKVLFRN